MNFVSSSQLTQAIKEVTSSRAAKCAVAFWGNGGAKLFPSEDLSGVKIVCNLSMGGTNPTEIKRLQDRNADIRQHDYLHAKVYIGPDKAVVCSANASSNGLGFEGPIELAGWEEAGVIIETNVNVSVWFDAIWKQSRPIEDDDLKVARKLWHERRKCKPTPAGFPNFDPDAFSPSPLVTWIGSTEWEYNKEEIVKQLGGFGKRIQEMVDEGLEVEHKYDRDFLKPGTWVLCWYADKRDLPKVKSGMWWVYVGDTIERSFRYEGERLWRPTALAMLRRPPEPFNIKDPIFRNLLRNLLATDKYRPLTETDYPGAWFAPRANLMKKLWHELKQAYPKHLEKQVA